jgi:hypothetical protein
MSHQGPPRWKRRPLLALAARSTAVLLPLAVSAVTAVLVLDAFTGWTAAWRVVWWTCVVVGCIVTALACLPVARRLSALGVLLGLEIEFPSAAPSRVRLAVGASTIATAQFELARTARATTTDELLTARMATASMLGALRTMEVRIDDRARFASTLAVALCVAVTALLVVPDRAQSPTSPLAVGQFSPPAARTLPAPDIATPTTPFGRGIGHGGQPFDNGSVESAPVNEPPSPANGAPTQVVAASTAPPGTTPAQPTATSAKGAVVAAVAPANPGTPAAVTQPPPVPAPVVPPPSVTPTPGPTGTIDPAIVVSAAVVLPSLAPTISAPTMEPTSVVAAAAVAPASFGGGDQGGNGPPSWSHGSGGGPGQGNPPPGQAGRGSE